MRRPAKPRRPRARVARPVLRAGLAVGLALLAGCRAVDRTPPAAASTGAPVAVLSPASEAAFQALRSALAQGEDEVAAGILARLRRGALSARERELVEGAERVLAGRALVRTLELELVSEPVPGESASFRLVLRARSQASAGVRLRLPPCDLKRRRTTMDARGVEGLDYESRASSALAKLELEPGVERRVEILSYELPLGRALAVRERWRLETRSGEIESAGAVYPAAAVRVAGCERERLSPLLDPAPATSTDLAERLAAETPPRARELLELALRTPRADVEACLAELAPLVERLAAEAPERVQASEPALRWLTQNRDLGPDAGAWARYLTARVAAGDASDAAPPGGLDLPARPRGAGRHDDRGQAGG